MSCKTKKNTPNGATFLGLSFQAGILIFLSAWGGMKLDQFVGTKPLFVLLFSLLAVAFSMYYIIRKANNKN
jgi:F0F1-type ATP synthase assembly protein I